MLFFSDRVLSGDIDYDAENLYTIDDDAASIGVPGPSTPGISSNGTTSGEVGTAGSVAAASVRGAEAPMVVGVSVFLLRLHLLTP